MRVLLVVNTLPPRDLSGVGEQVLQLAAGLRAKGHQVKILGRGKDGARGPKVLFPILVIRPFLRTCRRFLPHVVQVHESDGALAALALRSFVSGPGAEAKLVALLQVSYREEMRAVRTIRWGDRILGSPSSREWFFRCVKAPIQVAQGCLTGWLADLVLAPSRQTALEVQRDYGLDRVGVLHNVTSKTSEPSAETVEGEDDSPYFLYVGRLRIRKGVEVLLHALRQLPEESFNPRLVIVGEGEHRKTLEGVTAELKLEERVVFVGKRSKSEIAQLMSSASALVVPSLYEGMPLVILEAMSYGLPVVASRVSGIPEVVRHGETGWLVDPEDVDSLARALEAVVAESDEAQRRGQAGRLLVETAANPSAAANRWTELIEEAWPRIGSADRDSREGIRT